MDLENLKKQAEEGFEAAKDKVGDVVEAVKDKAEDAKDKAEDAVDAAKDELDK